MKLSYINALALALVLVGSLAAQPIVTVNSDIAVSTTWTASNVYDLSGQIFVLPGATLTIEAGTVIASTSTATGSGSLAVSAGAKIFVEGTETAPVIMTSSSDRATWGAGGTDPSTGTWREAANEWGNLTIMGRGYISENATGGNVPTPSGANVAAMEGLVAAFPGDTKVLYGGEDDNDDSGSISYLSIRYGGRVVGLNNELNGLSLGGIGRETDINHIEIMNNVDDGIEIWGGTVNLKYFSIWNVGDDSFDVDQGWRGKAQFGLIVQGYSLNANQGSGVGDNGFEMDGAEDSDWQPVTTATIYNCTFVGQPADGDHATAWRDNARVQFRNCIFTDTGDDVVRFDNVDGDGANGYGHNGTLSWAATWTTPYTATSTVNPGSNPADLYQAQSSGNLAEITDSVFYGNIASGTYNEAMTVGVFAPANNNVMEPANSPITSITRGPAIVRGNNKVMLPVIGLDPCPANDALVSVAFAPQDGFFDGAAYRGAFVPGVDWLCGWTASSAFGYTGGNASCDLGSSIAAANGAPIHNTTGSFAQFTPVSLNLERATPSTAGYIVYSVARNESPVFGLVPDIDPLAGGFLPIATDASGNFSITFGWPFPAGAPLYTQFFHINFGGPALFAASNAVLSTGL